MVKKLLPLFFLLCLLTGCEDIFEVTDISNEQVQLLAPTNQSVVMDSIVNFNWNGVEEADAYLIQVATPDFENAIQIVLDTVVSIDSTFVGNRISKQLPDNTYQWRVQAQNSAFSTAFSTNGFTVQKTN
ncbi:MAG: hypothetical protein AAGC45_06655 [Bacteroidota bacterium]